MLDGFVLFGSVLSVCLLNSSWTLVLTLSGNNAT
jgi:hypothetical protein